MTSPKIIVRTKYQYSILNPDNKYNSKKQEKLKKYTNRMLDYYSDIEKKAVNLIDYYTGKINKDENINLILENGKYATEEQLKNRKEYIGKQINKSNLWQMVVSFNNDYIDSNIKIEDLEKIMATDVIPKFLKHMGFVDIKKMNYQLSLHTNTDNYHFHIAFLEKSPNTYNSNNVLCYRRLGKISKKSINFLKNETVLSIEREKEFKPKSIELNKEIDEIKQYFKFDSYNYILKDKQKFQLEEQIIKLGMLLEEKNESNNNKLKFNSIKNKEIKDLTKNIMKNLFNDNNELKKSKKEFEDKVNIINSYFETIAKSNNISSKDIDYSYTLNKEKYLNNYILNSIVNYARNNYKNQKINVIRLKPENVIQNIILKNYKKKRNITRKNLVSNYLKNRNFYYQNAVKSALKNINNEMDQAVEEFSKLFNHDSEYNNSMV